MVPDTLWPLGIYFAGVLVIVGAMLGLPAVLGQRHEGHSTGKPYESGVEPSGTARQRFDVQFFLTAALFVIFDVETAFLVLWAVSARDVGWTAYLGVLFFVGVLAVALFYESRVGALDWVRGRRRGQPRA